MGGQLICGSEAENEKEKWYRGVVCPWRDKGMVTGGICEDSGVIVGRENCKGFYNGWLNGDLEEPKW